jgi:hypothetical protein
MLLLELAELLNAAPEFSPKDFSRFGAKSAGEIRAGLSWIPQFHNAAVSSSPTSLLEALRARLGDSPEVLNKFALIRHSAEATRSCHGLRRPMTAELMSTILGYFMNHTVPPRTRGLVYCRSRHPLRRLLKRDRVFTIVGARVPPTALDPGRVGISTVMAVLRDARDEEVFRARILDPLTCCIAESGLDVMIIGRTPELASAVADAVAVSGKRRALDFPKVESRLGLTGISLRCFSQT